MIELGIAVGEELERLVQCCIKHLKEDGNVCLVVYPNDGVEYESERIEKKISYGREVCGPVWKKSYSDRIERLDCSGNLYALHIRPCCGSKWKLKYVGTAKDLNGRLRQHLVRVTGKTHSALWKVAHNVSKGYQVGVSCVEVVQSKKRKELNIALAKYMEHCIVDRLGAENLWNDRKG